MTTTVLSIVLFLTFCALIFVIVRWKTLAKQAAELDQMVRSENLKASEKDKYFAQEMKEERWRSEKLKAEMEKSVRDLQTQNTQLEKKIATLETFEIDRQREFNEKVTRLTQAYDDIRGERAREVEIQERERLNRAEELKRAWQRHERDVSDRLQALCLKYQIEYVQKEQFPYKGSPDNSIKILNEFVVFDSKAPEAEDLKTFHTYIKAQCEQVKKYTEFEDVKNDVFFVVPTTSLNAFKDTYFDMSHSRVHVICPESLENLLIVLKKIEDYEFAEGFSPEDRESLISVFGRWAHLIKRKVQVDQFFTKEFITQLRAAESLPEDILMEAQKIEKASRLNPPQERRGKRIEIKELEKEQKKVASEILHNQINLEVGFDKIDQIPLLTGIQPEDV